jgi:hypothetical protein
MKRTHLLFAFGIAATLMPLESCGSTTKSTNASTTQSSGSSPKASSDGSALTNTVPFDSAPPSTQTRESKTPRGATVPPSTEGVATGKDGPVTADVATTFARSDVTPLLHRSWHVATYETVDGQQPVSGDYGNTLAFLLDAGNTGMVTTQGCVVEAILVTFNDDATFLVGRHIGATSVCANPADERQHVDDPLVEGSIVRWSVGDDHRLTLTPTKTTNISVVYDDMRSTHG